MNRPSDKQLYLHINEDYTITTKFKGESLEWDGSVFKKMKYDPNAFDLFLEINEFLRIQPMEVQEHLFNGYKRIHRVLHQYNLSTTEQASQLIKEIREFTSVFDWEEMNRFIRGTTLINIPDVFADKYIHPSEQKVDFMFERSEDDDDVPFSRGIVQASTREKTYLRSDALDLTAMTVYFRLFNPIWGHYIATTKGDISSNFKEYYAGHLLLGSRKITESPGYKKLHAYLTAHVEKSERIKNAVLDGLSSEDFPYWVLNLVILHRITIGDVRGVKTSDAPNAPTTHLVTYIHAYVMQRILKTPDSSLHGKICNKEVQKQNANDGDDRKISIFEAVRVSEDFSPGDIVELGLYYSDPNRIVEVLCPDLPPELLEQSLTAVRQLCNSDLHNCQIQIVQWMIGPYLPPSSIWNLNMLQLLVPVAVCQAILWHRGHYDIAAILTLTPAPSGMGVASHITRSNIPANMIDEAAELFPHYKRTTARVVRGKRIPDVVEVVKDMTQALLDLDWHHNLPEGWQLPNGAQGLRAKEYRIPSDIRIKLMEIVLKIGRYRYPFHAEPVA